LMMKKHVMDHQGAVAVVTGGARGLGFAIAKAYAQTGMKIVLVDLRQAELKQATSQMQQNGFKVESICCDVTDSKQVGAMVNEVVNAHKVIDILVNCAGTLIGIGPVWEVDIDKWKMDLLVSFFGSFLCCRAVLPHMMKRSRGYILNMFGGGLKPQPYMTGYVGAKAGLLLFTEGLAGEVHDFGIKVFAMRPGPVRTELNEHIMKSIEGQRWRPDFKKIFDEGRDVDPQRVVDLALRLVSGEADKLSGRLFDATRDFDTILKQSDSILHDDLLTLRVKDILENNIQEVNEVEDGA